MVSPSVLKGCRGLISAQSFRAHNSPHAKSVRSNKTPAETGDWIELVTRLSMSVLYSIHKLTGIQFLFTLLSKAKWMSHIPIDTTETQLCDEFFFFWTPPKWTQLWVSDGASLSSELMRLVADSGKWLPFMPLYEADCHIAIWWTPILLAWVTFQWVSLGRKVHLGNTAASDWNGSTFTMWCFGFFLFFFPCSPSFANVLVMHCMKVISTKITMRCLLWVSGRYELWEWLAITASSNNQGPRKIRQ